MVLTFLGTAGLLGKPMSWFYFSFLIAFPFDEYSVAPSLFLNTFSHINWDIDFFKNSNGLVELLADYAALVLFWLSTPI